VEEEDKGFIFEFHFSARKDGDNEGRRVWREAFGWERVCSKVSREEGEREMNAVMSGKKCRTLSIKID
jgi:hypothetical protein